MTERNHNARRQIVGALLLGVASFLSARFALLFLIRPEGMAPFWFINGVVLAVLLRRPLHHWPLLLSATFIGFITNMLLAGFPPYPDGVYGVVNVVEPLIAAAVISRFHRRFAVKEPKALLLLIMSATLACSVGAT